VLRRSPKKINKAFFAGQKHLGDRIKINYHTVSMERKKQLLYPRGDPISFEREHSPLKMKKISDLLPRISVVIPTLNASCFLEKALDSLADQQYPELEVIVVDGASTDGTVELLKKRKDLVSQWISEADEGQTYALNKGFATATGEVFGWLNSDERYLPGSLRLVGRTFAAELDLDIVFGHRVVVDVNGNEMDRMKLPAIHPAKYALYSSGLLFSDTTFWKSDLHRRTGRLDEANCPGPGNDFDWFFRMGLNVKRWKRLDAYLSEFTQHEGRLTYNDPEVPRIARDIRKRIQEQAGISPIQVIIRSPFYGVLSRYGRIGWRGLLRPPKPSSILRIAGLIR